MPTDPSVGREFFIATQVCKPGSVLTAIYLVLQSLAESSHLLGTVGPTYCSSTALLRIEFTAPACLHEASALLPHFFTLTTLRWRHLSVALVLGSPPAGVTCYPCPVEPGLSSPGCFRSPAAAVRPGRGIIVLHAQKIVKCIPENAGVLLKNPKKNFMRSGICLQNILLTAILTITRGLLL